jgi:DNA (cytosine-5)-methyltransferase 1
MLHLDGGQAMRYLVAELEDRRLMWAYRIVDTRAFGLPQRRQRVILVASKKDDPRDVLFADDAAPVETSFSRRTSCGFYWTEGLRGLGWAVDAVPTLKGGSTIGIPSPPAIWSPTSHALETPDIRDVERLQGFEADWTLPATEVSNVRASHRWKLVGNAVSVPVARWLGERLVAPGAYRHDLQGHCLGAHAAWPKAAWGHRGKIYPVAVSRWPVRILGNGLRDFLRYPTRPLSLRAAAGFLSRAEISTLRFEEGFLTDVRKHVTRLSRSAVA